MAVRVVSLHDYAAASNDWWKQAVSESSRWTKTKQASKRSNRSIAVGRSVGRHAGLQAGWAFRGPAATDRPCDLLLIRLDTDQASRRERLVRSSALRGCSESLGLLLAACVYVMSCRRRRCRLECAWVWFPSCATHATNATAITQRSMCSLVCCVRCVGWKPCTLTWCLVVVVNAPRPHTYAHTLRQRKRERERGRRATVRPEHRCDHSKATRQTTTLSHQATHTTVVWRRLRLLPAEFTRRLRPWSVRSLRTTARSHDIADVRCLDYQILAVSKGVYKATEIN